MPVFRLSGTGGPLLFFLFLLTAGPPPEAAESSGSFTLAVSGDTLGNLEVCGCPKDPAGGLTRRAYSIDRYRTAGRHVLPVECGGFWTMDEPIDNERILTYLQGLEMMNYGPVLLGAAEFSHPRTDLEFLVSQVDVPFVATNVNTATGDEAPWDTAWTGEVGGLEVAVLGVTRGATPELMERHGFLLRDPGQALLEHVSAVRPGADVLILLTDLGEKAAELMDSVPGIDILVNVGSSLMYQKTGDTLSVFASHEGRSLRLATARKSDPDKSTSYSVREKDLHTEVPEDPTLRAFLDGWYADVASRPEFAWPGIPPAPGAADATSVFVGDEACASCHENYYRIVQPRPHASAMLSIHRQQRYFLPRCFACHVTGYGYEGGYDGGHPRHPMRGVQCEACHGPGSRHTEDPEIAPPISQPTRSTCETCHDAENSPRFSDEFDRYWEAAKHTD
jgi:hypothetical protein